MSSIAGHAGQIVRHENTRFKIDRLVAKYGFNAAYQIAQAYAFRGQPDQAFQWLDRAFAQRDGGLAEVKYDPLMRSLRKDPRFQVLLERMGLPR